MNIQWFPGHMLETQKLLKAAVTKVDALVEVLDARLPIASANLFVDKLCKNKFRLKILNKSDLAHPDITSQWLEYFQREQQIPALAICGNVKKEVFFILRYILERIEINRAQKIKIMIVGIPNTGKSTILNTLVGKKVAKTGNVPAITRHQQRISLQNNIDLYDTPGILWPVIEPREMGYMLAVSGAISDVALDYHDIAIFAASFLIREYPDLLQNRYPFLEISSTDSTYPMMDPESIIEKIGIATGCFKKGGVVNFQKASGVLVRDLRSGRIGRISFEKPL